MKAVRPFPKISKVFCFVLSRLVFFVPRSLGTYSSTVSGVRLVWCGCILCGAVMLGRRVALLLEGRNYWMECFCGLQSPVVFGLGCILDGTGMGVVRGWLVDYFIGRLIY